MFNVSKIVKLIFLVIVILGLLLIVPFKTSLVFYKENTNQLMAYLPLSKGDRFQIIFTHSIHLTDVVEKYIVMENHDIKQYEIIFEEFGIGMPSNAEPGEKFVYEDGKYHIQDMNNIFSSLNIRNGKTVSEHRLVWGSEEENRIRFNDYFKPGAWFTMKIERLSFWELLKGVKIHE